ncbi:hypothetical protein NDU88_007847 [Pleurodeles waltl]|uniref:Uncharacterized protein n=1 Tax=Pleurodeles waltl TaxID=8319 RepID=A0AAV7N368_PLEWA|nr:hypothetical protein NDU88_007847 [Pleurodeles waltl]
MGDLNVSRLEAQSEESPLDRGRQLLQTFIATFRPRLGHSNNLKDCPFPSSFNRGSTIDYVYLSAHAAEKYTVIGASTGTEKVPLARRVKWKLEHAAKISSWLKSQPQEPNLTLEWWEKLVDDLMTLLHGKHRDAYPPHPAWGNVILQLDKDIIKARRSLCSTLRKQKQQGTKDTVAQVTETRRSLKKQIWELKMEKDQKEKKTIFQLLKDPNHALFLEHVNKLKIGHKTRDDGVSETARVSHVSLLHTITVSESDLTITRLDKTQQPSRSQCNALPMDDKQ